MRGCLLLLALAVLSAHVAEARSDRHLNQLVAEAPAADRATLQQAAGMAPAPAPGTTVAPAAAPAPAPAAGEGESSTRGKSSGGSGNGGGRYTLAEVAQHASPDSIWVAIRGKVYDVTVWPPEHPGGDYEIYDIAGTDATEKFTEQHGGGAFAERQLAEFYIGELAD